MYGKISQVFQKKGKNENPEENKKTTEESQWQPLKLIRKSLQGKNKKTNMTAFKNQTDP